MTPIHFDAVLDLLRRLTPFPEHTVLCGAWTIALYQSAFAESVDPVATLDLDLALDGASESIARQDAWMRDMARDLGELGYVPVRRGADYGAGSGPFVTLEFRPGPLASDLTLPEVELIASVRGGGQRPPRSLPWTCVEPVPQIVDQLHLLFAKPRVLRLGGFAPFEVRVPNPLSFVLQKALIRAARRRRQGKAESDAASMVEIASLFRRRGEDVAQLAGSLRAQSRAAAKDVERGVSILREQFLDPRSQALDTELVRRRRTLAEARELVRGFLEDCGIAPS